MKAMGSNLDARNTKNPRTFKTAVQITVAAPLGSVTWVIRIQGGTDFFNYGRAK